jgi:hypothetical protein
MTLSLLSVALFVGFVFFNIVSAPLGNTYAASPDTPRLSDNSIALLTSELNEAPVRISTALASTPAAILQAASVQVSPPLKRAPTPQETLPGSGTFTVTPIHHPASLYMNQQAH